MKIISFLILLAASGCVLTEAAQTNMEQRLLPYESLLVVTPAHTNGNLVIPAHTNTMFWKTTNQQRTILIHGTNDAQRKELELINREKAKNSKP